MHPYDWEATMPPVRRTRERRDLRSLPFGTVMVLAMITTAVATASLLLLAPTSNAGATLRPAGAPVVTPAEGVRCKQHTVVSGDTMSGIAKRYGTTLPDLDAWNPQVVDLNRIFIDDKVCITAAIGIGEAAPAPEPAPLTPPQAEGEEWRTVWIPATGNGDNQPDETLRHAVWTWFGDLGVDVYVRTLMVSRCESTFNADAHRSTRNLDLMSGDIGALQISYIHAEALTQAGIISRSDADGRRELFDPYVNARAARWLYDQRGHQPWYPSKHCHRQG